jgi:hypothetical protein
MMQKFWTKFVTSDGDPKACYVVVDDYTKHSFCQANLVDPQPTIRAFINPVLAMTFPYALAIEG